MTREEAIEVLKANYPSKCFEQLREAVDMAIKALEAQDRKVDVEQATADFAKKLEEGYFKPRRKCLADYLSDDPSLLRKVGAEELGIESPSKRSEQTGEKQEPTYYPPCIDCNKKMDEIRRAYDKLKEQEPCEDCISRQAALDIVDSYSESRSNVEDVTQDMISDILALPPVNPQEPKWIPVSERLPEEREWYLAVFKERDTDYQLIPRVADYIGENNWRIIDEDGLVKEYRDILECVAWMPLPEPYEEIEE